MTRLRALAGGVLLVAVCFALWTPPAAGAQNVDTLTVSLAPADATVVLGETTTLSITVTNGGNQASSPVVVHLDVTDPAEATSVDPEDWTPTLTKPVGVVAPGETRTLEWEIQPIAPGTFVAYAVALSPGLDTLAASNVMRVSVADQRSLNPGGILPVAIGAPLVVGALLVVQLRLARRPIRRVEPRLAT